MIDPKDKDLKVRAENADLAISRLSDFLMKECSLEYYGLLNLQSLTMQQILDLSDKMHDASESMRAYIYFRMKSENEKWPIK